jgi:pimeloyl-ACP methyl ester carboxylesterase
MTDNRSHIVTTTDGRALEVRELGDPAGRAVVFHHGTPGTCLMPDWWDRAARNRGVRVVGLSRPGYGGSTRRTGRTVGDVAADTAAVADALGIERFATWGTSGGGPHALACGALLPGRCHAVACVAGVAPYGVDGLDWLDGMGEGNHLEFGAALQGLPAIEPFLADEAAAMSRGTRAELVAAMDTLLSPPDRAVIDGPVGDYLIAAAGESVSAGVGGWADDDIAFTRPWGLEPGDVRVPTTVWQGSYDLMVPQSHARWLAAALPQADLRFLPAHGHLTLAFADVEPVLDWLAAVD